MNTTKQNTDLETDFTQHHILVVDDDQLLRRLLTKYLTKNDFLVSGATNSQDAWHKLKFIDFNCLILDRMMPGQSGIEFARELRRHNNNMPIIMLTAKGEVTDRIEGLEAGVDDYITKPFEPKELLLRINNVLKRSFTNENGDHQLSNRHLIQLGEVVFNKNAKILERNGVQIHLTTAEIDLLTILSDNLNEVLSRKELATQMGVSSEERSIDVQITRIRKKIEENIKSPRFIQTVRGQGYILRI